MREVLEVGLGKAGYHCVTAEGANQASALLEREDFDLVLLDINMPEKSGMAFLPELTVQYPDIAAIMLTGEAEVSLAVRAMREGAYDYALKPIGLAELIIRIEHALSRRALRLENRAYEQKLERIVDELDGRLVQRWREVTALNNLLETHVGQNEAAQSALMKLKASLDLFNTEIQGLGAIAGLTTEEDGESQIEYQTKKAKLNPDG